MLAHLKMLTLDWLLWHCLLSDCLKICNINIKIIGKFWRSGMAKNEEPWWHLSGTPPSLILLNTNTISIHLYAILRTIIYIKNGIYTTTSAIVIWYAQILHLYSGAIKCNTIHQHQHEARMLIKTWEGISHSFQRGFQTSGVTFGGSIIMKKYTTVYRGSRK